MACFTCHRRSYERSYSKPQPEYTEHIWYILSLHDFWATWEGTCYHWSTKYPKHWNGYYTVIVNLIFWNDILFFSDNLSLTDLSLTKFSLTNTGYSKPRAYSSKHFSTLLKISLKDNMLFQKIMCYYLTRAVSSPTSDLVKEVVPCPWVVRAFVMSIIS